jgi:MFS transporter, DHA2 family, lincomycin resistance protein
VLAPFVGRLYDRFGPRPLVVPGSVMLVLVLSQYARLDASTPIGWVLALNVLMSASFAFIFTPTFTTGLNPLPHRLHSHGSALLSTLQQLGGAAGTALLVALMVAGTAAAEAGGAAASAAQVAGLQLGFTAAAVGGGGVFLLSLFLKKSVTEPQAQAEQAAPAAH